MNILILGAGQVGSTAAYSLAKEKSNEVTIVDSSFNALRDLQDRLDVRTIIGHGAHPEILKKAGAKETDILIALTDSDEVNIVACEVASKLFNIPTRIARIRAAEYINHNELFTKDAIAVDVPISPEELVTDHITELLRFPGALQVLEFAKGKVRLVAALARKGGALIGHPLKDMAELIPNIDFRVAAIYRGGQGIIPDGNTIIKEGDEVFFIAARKHIRTVLKQMRKLDSPIRKVVIAGGGNIGIRLAQALESKNEVKLIERDADQATIVSEKLDEAIVLNGDAADEELLLEENIDRADIFVSVTDSEEANILSAMLAKRLGARKVMALINRPAYSDLLEAGTIDIAISPSQITLGTLLAHIRKGDVVKVHALRRGAAEAIEAVAHGDSNNSYVIGKSLEEISLPQGVTIGSIVRGDEVLMAHHDIIIQPDDHIILFMTEKDNMQEVEKLFEVEPVSS
ncbi:MAG: Trk system potassium transporter TrkA [Pseudomonadota bacterium]|nr:Trk system potassium transporter TrkA [Pseudomonadota bacterium]|tara:strand:- start:141 stop:1517 length:1377 start_codon:yes stop_codon:yes gene_type:complete